MTVIIDGTNGITSAGNITMSTGGITFNANAGGGTQATLSDYEIGTFTGTLTGASTNPTTPITSTGTYIKVGKQVTVGIAFSNVDTTGASGSLVVTGLPFATHASIPMVGAPPMTYSLPIPGNYNAWYITSTTLNLYQFANAAGWNPVNISAGTGKYVWTTVTYITAS
ncbi:hypothetical protein [Bacteriophage sp.]|nr:hypothetical protein [Bacteriophage sp.]